MRKVSNLGLFLALLASSSEGAIPPAEISQTPGALVHSEIMRPSSSVDVCSMRHLACVHAEPAVADRAMDVLVSLDRAWDVMTGALDYPPPDPDPTTGVYDLYLVDRANVAETHLSERTVASVVDRASAFSILDGRIGGCQRDLEVARQLARAIGMRLAPATDEGDAHALATHVARLAVPCAMGLVDGVDVFQRHPEMTFVSALAPKPYRDGSALFFWWLDDAFGNMPGALGGGIWITTPTRTPEGADRFAGEPDVFDVLRTTMRGVIAPASNVDDLLLDFAVTRAFPGSIDEWSTFGSAMKIEDDWSIDWPTKARALAAPKPLGPLGSSYVRVGQPPKGKRLRIEIEWENHARMRWVALKLGADGKEKARIPIASHDRTTSANLTLSELDETSQILLVGLHCGDWEPFDPEDREWSPHGWIATLAQEN